MDQIFVRPCVQKFSLENFPNFLAYVTYTQNDEWGDWEYSIVRQTNRSEKCTCKNESGEIWFAKFVNFQPLMGRTY